MSAINIGFHGGRYFLYWYDDEGAMIGAGRRPTNAQIEKLDGEDLETALVERAAFDHGGIRGWTALFWESETEAKDARRACLEAMRAAKKTKREPEHWEAKALKAGWTPPKGWR